MGKYPYKVSKAWHYGHKLAQDVYEVAIGLYEAGETELAEKIHEASRTIPYSLVASLEQTIQSDKEACYQKAHQALAELQTYLRHLMDRGHIEKAKFESLSQQSDNVYLLLKQLVEPSKPQLQPIVITTEENNGTINHQPEERDTIPVGGPTVPSGRLQPESDGARRINRQRPHQKFARWEGLRKNF